MAETTRRRPPAPVILGIVLLLALLGTGGWYWWQSQQPSAAAALTAAGAVETKQYQVASVIAGRVTSVAVAEGDHVTAGQALVQLDTAALDLQVQQAEQGVVAAQAAVDNANSDGTDADITAANARLAQAQAAVDLAKLQQSYATVTAPHDGTVLSVTTNAGQNAAPGRTLITLTDPADLFARVYVPETQVGNVKVGQTVNVTTDSSTKTFQGTVTFVSSQSEFTPNNVATKDQRVKLVYEVRVSVKDDTGTLTAGMPVEATFA